MDVNPNEPNIVLDWTGLDDNEYRWSLVPLRQFDDSTDEPCFDKLLIFEEPQPGAEYAIAIDTAGGLNKPNEDRASLKVQKYGHGREPDVEVASFTSLRVNSPQMARIAAAVAVLYGTDGNGNLTSANPLVVKFIIEQTRKPGDECQSQLKIMGFLDHHVMLQDRQEGQHPARLRASGGMVHPRLYQTVSARSLGGCGEHGMDGAERSHCDSAVGDVRAEVHWRAREESEMIHEQGQHDDNIFASAMGWTTFHELENSSARIQSKWPLTPKSESRP